MSAGALELPHPTFERLRRRHLIARHIRAGLRSRRRLREVAPGPGATGGRHLMAGGKRGARARSLLG